MKYKAIVLLIVTFAFGLLLFVPIVRASKVEIQAKEDAEVKSTEPDTNFGDKGSIGVGVIFSDIFISYIQFDISSLESQGIESVSLKLRVGLHTGVMGSIELSFVESNWVEESITYNSQPSIIEFTRQFTDPYLVAGDFKSFSLKKEYLDNGNFISFKLERSLGMIIFDSKEAGVTENAPTLVILYAEPLVFPPWFIPIIIVGVLVVVGSIIEYKYFRKSSRIKPERGDDKLDNNRSR